MATTRRRRPAPPTPAVLAAAAVVLGWSLAAVWLPADVFGVVVSNLAQLGAAAAASLALAWRAVRSTGRLAWTWATFALACSCWTAGQLYWAVEEMSGHGIPFPSVADVGFLLFPVVAAVGLLLHPAEGGTRARWQRAMDAVMTAAAVGLVSWETSLGVVMAGGFADDVLSSLLLVAYPVLDVVLVVLTVATLARSQRRSLDLVLVAAGLVSIGVSDSTFAYLQTTGGYDGGLVDSGWVVGFLLVALAGTLPRPVGEASTAGSSGAVVRTALLPYVPVAAGLASSLVVTLVGRTLGSVETILATVVISLLLARQFLALRENVRLAEELAAREALLVHQASHDGLTGLANRALFRDRVERALQAHADGGSAVALVFLDLDDFKVVNDTLGHASGDELLIRVAERLTGAMRSGDLVARLGGDEFAVLLADDDAAGPAHRALEAFHAPFAVGARAVGVRASVGVCTVAPDDPPCTVDELLVRSDLAMYSAKRSGKDQVVSYTSGLHLAEVEDRVLHERLRAAIAASQVTLEYQPIVEVGTGRISSLEALARWRPGGIDVGPDVFIPVAERTGLIDELTAALLAEACAQVTAWSVEAGRPLSVHVNVPPSSLASPEFVRSVGRLVARHRLAAGQLVLEITESGILEDPAQAEGVVAHLRALGVGVSLDDFGVGQSSLARLGSIALDSVKIDRSFLERIDTDPPQATLLAAVLRLARDIGLPVVAEGVERPRQLEMLRELGCPLAQGFLLGQPVAAAAVPGLLSDQLVALTP
ncbi:putative bifunctional diguanylate cyclase/phosphodiesterase [Blastococcus sp. SYSU D00669]